MFWLLLKIFLTCFTAILIPVYWRKYGIQNFLWLSDIGLFLTVLSLWTHSALLMSMAIIGALLVEIVWNIDFFLELLFNRNCITGLADYMFDSHYSLTLRGLSLFHIAMPLIWILHLAQYGYDTRALYYFTPLYWIILLITYCYTQPKDNINWVFYPHVYSIQSVSPRAWVLLLAIGFPLFIFLPTHLTCKALFTAVKYQDS
jgi:hypothetical protein